MQLECVVVLYMKIAPCRWLGKYQLLVEKGQLYKQVKKGDYDE